MRKLFPLLMLLLCGAPSARGKVDFEKLHNDYEHNLRLASRYPFRDFEKAVDANDPSAVRRFLDQGFPVSLQIPTPQDEWEGIPPSEQAIHLAARRSHLAMVRLLLDRGASPDARNSEGSTPLFLTSDPAIAHLLIARGANISARDRDRSQPIHRAATCRLELVKLLVRHGADPLARDHRGGRPLHDAACDGTLEIASYLLGRGSPVAAAISDPEGYYRNGWQALHFAAAREDSPDALSIAALLLRKGASVTATTLEGETALHLAKGESMTRLLLQNGAQVGATAAKGQTPLHAAALDGNTARIQLLLDHGADPNATRNDRSTPLDIAVFFGRTEAVKLLLARGAKTTAHTLDQARCQGDLSMVRKIRSALQGKHPVRPPAHRR
ncbi:MAG: ankyrin repeat domain-containing protein [Verrucomicrobia bacterium]|nr:MAG: ankyrin repeat domain-containing protein [Verrucomicrobiota bacterium]TAE88901.1 MAG: ankyrin repeat domain-containing protein [Verrucomicrobiota bacterium]TAF27318.1 MAG: ankyrin repeat domain-containing protein [Verrucomicrobiota bacterium]TAF42391.1 MAG: ankyrin repeat domain-containing protein [Verrucomicrobiota bacterium]